MANSSAKPGVAARASQQFGLISSWQLAELGVARATVHKWLQAGYLHRVLPRVYAVGRRADTTESKLAAALLYAGPGAMLSHATAAWWIGLVEHQPRRIDVSTPRRCRSVPGIRVHPRRHHERTSHKGLPVTRFEQTLVDYASTASLNDVRLALARADYQGSLNAPALAAGLQPGRPGGARLRRALERHLPDLARTRSRIERALLRLCETHDLPLPEVNVRIAGWEVDAVWREQRIVVEVDGLGNHRTPAQIRRDRRKEMALRAAGFVVLRYSDEQIFRQAREVAEELRQMLGPATAPPPGPAPGGGPPGPLAAGTPPTY